MGDESTITITEMIQEGGARWEAGGMDRQELPVVIALSSRPATVFELTLRPGATHPNWSIQERAISTEEQKALTECVRERGARFGIGVLAPINDHYFRTRGYVRNTRAPGQWLPSVEFLDVAITKRIRL